MHQPHLKNPNFLKLRKYQHVYYFALSVDWHVTEINALMYSLVSCILPLGHQCGYGRVFLTLLGVSSIAIIPLRVS